MGVSAPTVLYAYKKKNQVIRRRVGGSKVFHLKWFDNKDRSRPRFMEDTSESD